MRRCGRGGGLLMGIENGVSIASGNLIVISTRRSGIAFWYPHFRYPSWRPHLHPHSCFVTDSGDRAG